MPVAFSKATGTAVPRRGQSNSLQANYEGQRPSFLFVIIQNKGGADESTGPRLYWGVLFFLRATYIVSRVMPTAKIV